MKHFHTGFRCLGCNSHFDISGIYNCPECGSNLDATYAYEAIKREVDPQQIVADKNRSIWHYAPLLPLIPPDFVMQVPTPLSTIGWSPLYRARNLETRTATRKIWLKDDTRLPSASFKDRASAMVVAYALTKNIETICCASTGNAASALATMCSGTTVKAVIFCPEGTPEGKLAQTLIHGAKVYSVQGSYTQAVHLAQQAAAQFGWHNRNTGRNPYTREGKKTAGFEIAEQLGEGDKKPFRAPDVIVVPVGDGNIVSGIYKGFCDLFALGWIEKMPKFIGVTAHLAPSLYRAWQSGGEVCHEIPSTTIASGISVDVPEDGVAALRAIRDTGGVFVEATDEEMLEAVATMARETSVFCEPSCAAAYVGLLKARQLGAIRPDDEVVLQMTASGFKDLRSVLCVVPKPILVCSLDQIMF